MQCSATCVCTQQSTTFTFVCFPSAFKCIILSVSCLHPSQFTVDAERVGTRTDAPLQIRHTLRSRPNATSTLLAAKSHRDIRNSTLSAYTRLDDNQLGLKQKLSHDFPGFWHSQHGRACKERERHTPSGRWC